VYHSSLGVRVTKKRREEIPPRGARWPRTCSRRAPARAPPPPASGSRHVQHVCVRKQSRPARMRQEAVTSIMCASRSSHVQHVCVKKQSRPACVRQEAVPSSMCAPRSSHRFLEGRVPFEVGERRSLLGVALVLERLHGVELACAGFWLRVEG